MKSLLLGILLIVILGVGGLIYRNAIEHPSQPIACPMDAKLCPDGTSVGREGLSCTFPACPPPNVTLADTGLAFALPAGYVASTATSNASVLATFVSPSLATTTQSIVIYQYPIDASSTALDIIQSSAINDASGAPVSPSAFTSTTLGNHDFSVVLLGRFEGVVHYAYYLARGSDVLRFDAIQSGVTNWTDPALDPTKLPVNQDLRALLTTLQGA